MKKKTLYLKLKATEFIPLNFHNIEVATLDLDNKEFEELPFYEYSSEYNGNMLVGSDFYKANSIIVLADETR